jgi:hypothetical protein
VSIKNSRLFTVIMMVLMIVSQSVASAASYSMTKVSTTTAMSGEHHSCHDEEGMVIDAKDDSSAVDQSSAIDSSLDMTSDASSNCCDVDCHCPSGNCSSTALPLHIMPNGRLHSLSQDNEFPSQWVVSQFPSSLYRPPISL